MKRIAVISALLLAAAVLFAQEYSQTFLKNQGLTEDQISKLLALQDQNGEDLRKARADANVIKARLAQLLVNVNANMNEVEKAVRDAAELDVRIKLMQIRQELAVRKLLGDALWSRVTRALRQKRAAIGAKVEEKAAQGRNLSKEQREKALELMKELKQVLGEAQE